MEHVLAVDLGGTNLRVALVDQTGTVRKLRSRPTPMGKPDDVVVAILDLSRELIMTDGAPRLCGVGAPGPLDTRRGLVYETPNLEGWRDYPLALRLSAALGLEVSVVNDGDAAALGELRFGAGQGVRDLIYLGLGTGLGGGIILDGRLLIGADGIGAEIGHMVLEGKSAEHWVSAPGLVRTARRLMESKPSPALIRVESLTALALARAARGGDATALEAFRVMGRRLGCLLTSLAHIFNPELIVIGGGVSPSFDLLAPTALEEMRRRTFQRHADRLRLVPAQLGNRSGIVGAAVWAMERGGRT